MPAQVLDRETLYAAVWECPMRQVAADLGIPDVALKKICRKVEIPTPWRGYWRRREMGYEPKIPVLPKLSAKGVATVTVQGRLHPRPPEPEGLPEVSDIQQNLPASEPGQIAHPLIAKLRTSLNAGKPNEHQIIQPRAKRARFAEVSRAAIERTLPLLDTLLRGCEANQIGVTIDIKQSPVLRLRVEDEELGLSISEKVYRKDHVRTEREKRDRHYWGYPRYDYTPSGLLTLQVHGVVTYGTRTAWSDGKVKRLEDRVPEIIRGIFAAAKAQAARAVLRPGTGDNGLSAP